ncbi:hypothetical protein [Alteromonas halophila]|uniref:Uncharacterized protein n=1 Tax=Alteromonas halophila TaxID=516698 RepID=A0A918JI48_9ALTE|nr:hypothetical protein [Alteromonas halophila]GGW82798.1 hypothetical protein GCM10007391_14920 [Alteromonas halophila]
MSYEIVKHQRCVVVRLAGHVKVTDLLVCQEDTAFLNALDETSAVVYDYSDATQVDITQNDTVHLARLAEHMAQFMSPLTIIIIPHNPAEPQQARLYCETIKSDELDARVALSLDEALGKML